MNKNILLGGLAGGVVGLATALLFAPKSGDQLIKDAYKPLKPLFKGVFAGSQKKYIKNVRAVSTQRKSSMKEAEERPSKIAPKTKKNVKSVSKSKKTRSKHSTDHIE